MIGSLVIETCSQGHKFGKLMPDHPVKDGKARCPVCMAEGLDWALSQLASHGRSLQALEVENRNLKHSAGQGNH